MTNFFHIHMCGKSGRNAEKILVFRHKLKEQKNWSSSSFSEEQQCGLIKALVTLEESKHLLTGEQRKKSPITKEPLNREMDP